LANIFIVVVNNKITRFGKRYQLHIKLWKCSKTKLIKFPVQYQNME